MRALIHNKLITDFDLLTFKTNSNLLFSNGGKKFFKGEFGANEYIMTTDGINEDISGNTSTYRDYGFLVVWLEELESGQNDSEINAKVDRMNNREDVILDYIQKEPSSLNAWGNTQNPVINIFKIRLLSLIEDDVITTNGFGKVKRCRFNVSVNIVPQLL